MKKISCEYTSANIFFHIDVKNVKNCIFKILKIVFLIFLMSAESM